MNTEAASSLLVAETSEWFDWVRRELPLGGINLPDEETAVLFIAHALHLADRTHGAYRHLPDTLRNKLLRAAIVYQCWELQRNLRERAKWPPRPRTLPSVTATSYLRPLGTSGRHHLVEANDGIRYVVTIPSGLWTETLPATEVICSELARLMGLSAPGSAIVVTSPRLLRLADESRPNYLKPKPRYSGELCCGFRYIEPLPEAVDSSVEGPSLGRVNRFLLLGALVFDLWVANLGSGNYVFALNQTTRRPDTVFFDHSHCLTGGDWSRFVGFAGHLQPCLPVRLAPTDVRHLRRWIRRISKVDMNPLWELMFEMPPNWYGGRRAQLAEILDKLTCRRGWLNSEVDDLLRSPGRSLSKRPCESAEGCVLRLACRLHVARLALPKAGVCRLKSGT